MEKAYKVVYATKRGCFVRKFKSYNSAKEFILKLSEAGSSFSFNVEYK